MDVDIDFGELEESAPQVQLRPDRNKHYAVAEVGPVDEEELPIFVDMDVMWDMEEHALTDTTVELGGVMLGGQFEDDEGKPFVLVSDSLRAKHYESTKGSFKFTHDTWSEITRQREEFPDDLQMVGWYHTHPDWGVFLSGMDMFICDNFFNRSLDVALVIDPCRDDRGMFMWTGNTESRIRRTNGFYVVSSRFRQAELELFAAQLEGSDVMNDPRFRTMGGQGSPVVNIADQNSWQGVAVLGMLTMQFVLLLLIACKLLFPSLQFGEDERVNELEKRVAQLQTTSQRTIESEAQAKVLDRVLSELKGQPPGQFTAMVKTQNEAEHWKASANGQLALQRELTATLDKQETVLKKTKSSANSKEKRLNQRITSLTTKQTKLEGDYKKLKTKLAKYEDPEDADGYKIFGMDWWLVVVFGVVIVGLIGVGIFASMNPGREYEYGGRSEEPQTEDEDEESDRQD